MIGHVSRNLLEEENPFTVDTLVDLLHFGHFADATRVVHFALLRLNRFSLCPARQLIIGIFARDSLWVRTAVPLLLQTPFPLRAEDEYYLGDAVCAILYKNRESLYSILPRRLASVVPTPTHNLSSCTNKVVCNAAWAVFWQKLASRLLLHMDHPKSIHPAAFNAALFVSEGEQMKWGGMVKECFADTKQELEWQGVFLKFSETIDRVCSMLEPLYGRLVDGSLYPPPPPLSTNGNDSNTDMDTTINGQA